MALDRGVWFLLAASTPLTQTDAHGQRISKTQKGDALTQEAVTRYEYDGYGNLTKITDAENHVTEYPSADYDVMGNPTRKLDARGKVWTRSYDKRGRVLSHADPLSHATRYGYDKAGWLTTVTDTLNNLTQFGYDGRKNLIAITDPYGAVTRYTYTEDNQPTQLIDAENKTVQTSEYDLEGRLIQQTDGNGNAVRYVYGDEASGLNGLLVQVIYPTFRQEYKYDSRNRIVEVIDVLDSDTRQSTKTTYDAQGNTLTTTDANARTTVFGYDALGRQVAATDALSGITRYGYDARDNLLTVTDPKQQTHRFAYDRLNRKTQEARPLGQTLGYTYTATGQLESLTDPKGQVRKYSYDDAGRVTGESQHPSVGAAPIKALSYSYTALNALSGYSDGSHSGSLSYDAKQLRRTGETVNYGAFTLSYGYDYFANGQKKSFTGPDGLTVHYSYDSNNQLANLQLPAGNITVNSYQWSAPSQITYPGGSLRRQSVDALLRPTQLQVTNPGQGEVMTYQYGYDAAGNITHKHTEHGNYTYGYDELYRLTQADNPSPLPGEAYTYDAVGNRLTDSKTPGTWTYNANNQLLTHNGLSYDYDANGNTTRKTDGNTPGQSQSYVYDTSDRLVEVRASDDSLIARYRYDPLGRRIAKESQGTTTYYLYADEGLIAEADAAGSIIKTYGWQPDGLWGTDPVYLRQGATTYYYQNDHLGTPQKLITQSGAVVWSARAEAFGATTVEPTSTVTNNLRFPGQYFDQETGLHYNYFRDYNPATGRYVESDPIGLRAGPNIYGYVAGNPLFSIDPTGLCSCVSLSDMTGKMKKDHKVTYDWWKQDHSVKCYYSCTGDDGVTEELEGTHKETYYLRGHKSVFGDDGTEGDCLGAVFSIEYNPLTGRPASAIRERYWKFDPTKQDRRGFQSEDLKNWAESHCKCGS